MPTLINSDVVNHCDNHAPPGHAPSGHVQRMTNGIFEVAYEKPTIRFLSFHDCVAQVQELQTSCFFAIRLLTELIRLSPSSFLIYTCACLWSALASAFPLLLTAILLDEIVHYVQDPIHFLSLPPLAIIWCCSTLITSFANRFMTKHARHLNAIMKLYFYPQFAKVCLGINLTTLQEQMSKEAFPLPWGYEYDTAHGGEFLACLSLRLRDILSLSLQCLVLAYIFAKETFDNPLLATSCLLVLTFVFLAPDNGVYGAGYTFWTKNSAYHRLAALHSIIFDPTYRPTLMKDAATEYIHRDYEMTMKKLGVMEIGAATLHYGIPVSWHWDLLHDLLADLPLVWSVITPYSAGSVSSLMTAIVIRQAFTDLENNLKRLSKSKSFHEILRMAQSFYETLDLEDRPRGTLTNYLPSPESLGMKLSIQNVSVRYSYSGSENSENHAIENMSLEIAPGQLVLVVGANGSGKTTFLNLLTGFVEPASGQVLIDDKPLREYNIGDLRSYMAILAQNEEIYPVSLRDNLLLGLAEQETERALELTEKMDAATRMGGSYDLVQRLGYDRILNPVGYFAASSEYCGNPTVGEAAWQEMRLHNPVARPVPISGGEKQRFIASRLFMKLNNSRKPIKLLIADETSALDPISEREFLDQILGYRKGKTTILVTHRFGPLVKRVDLILVMGAGKLLQCGNHDELIADGNGEYSKLYHAQVDGIAM